MTPQDLLDAYRKASQMPVSMSYQREMDLTEMVKRELTPEDVTNVILDLKKKISQDRTGTYTPVSLQWRNCMNPDTMEERALGIRMERLRKAPPKPQVARETSTGFTVLDSPVAPDPAILDVRGSLISLANNLRNAS